MRITKVEQGLLEGLPAADPRITVFKGIPFAKPPVGDLRWAPPQEAEKWEGVRQSFKFPPTPLQPSPEWKPRPDDIYAREWSVDPEIDVSEDCLYLNVWTPASMYKDTPEDSTAMPAGKKYPVYFWIFGGGFQVGHCAEMEFDGERIARRGIVVVTINYRVNLFGFLSHPEITKEYPEQSANFGFWDQRKALEWVYKNISAFGGDPEQITIGGQSAGGGSVLNQIAFDNFAGSGACGGTGKTAMSGKRIVNKALCESGMFINPWQTKFPFHTLKDAEELGVEFFDFCGVKTLKEARALSTDTLRQKWSDFGGFWKSAMVWGPVSDGQFIRGDIFKLVKENKITFPSFMTGWTSGEFYDGPEGCKVEDKVSTVELAVRHLHENFARNGCDGRNYVYKFDVPIPGWDNPGDFHSVDLWFFFENLAKCWRPFTGIQYDMARQICNYLCNFIKTGNPNGLDDFNCYSYSRDSDCNKLPEWKNYSTEKPNVMTFKTDCKCSEEKASPLMKKTLAEIN